MATGFFTFLRNKEVSLKSFLYNERFVLLAVATEVEEQNMMNTPTFEPLTKIPVGQKLVQVAIQPQLGAGNFGVVYKVNDVATSIEYALKDVLCSEKPGRRKSDVEREIQTLRKIFHPNVISIIEEGSYQRRYMYNGTNLVSTHMLILTEYCPCGNLNDRLTRESSKEG